MEKGGSMTLKVIRGSRSAAVVATLAMTVTIAMLAALAFVSSAFADHDWGSEPPVTLSGEWAPFTRCPVDNPTMLAVDGIIGNAGCVADISPSGSMTIGSLTVAFKGTNHQFGLDLGEGITIVSPAGGVLLTEPVQLPGGLQELICPSQGHGAWRVCRHSHGPGRSGRDAVTWTLESAGVLTNFNLFAGLGVGVPFSTTPVRVHLQSRLLGDDCYIGSEAEPIITLPANLELPSVAFIHFEANGTLITTEGEEKPGELLAIVTHSPQEGASAFTVPAASGCGFRGFYDQAIDSKVGLPSSASTNSLVFKEAVSSLAVINSPEAVAPNDGKELAKDWHAAVLPPEKSGHGSGHQHDGDGWHWSRDGAEEDIRHMFRHGH
jgi:hypothetical protein